jgi:hypothetical protein
MRMNITWKTAILALIVLVAIATVGMNGGAESRTVARSATVGLVDCSIRDPFSPCFDIKIGYPAADLLILDVFY